MEFTFTPTFGAVVVSMLLVAHPSLGLAQDPDQALHDWQVRRLMRPLPQELEKERRGNVYIYDGLAEQEVETALNKHFDRIQYMMFMGTIKTDTSGQPLTDAATGQVIQESGGCSSPE